MSPVHHLTKTGNERQTPKEPLPVHCRPRAGLERVVMKERAPMTALAGLSAGSLAEAASRGSGVELDCSNGVHGWFLDSELSCDGRNLGILEEPGVVLGVPVED